MLDSLTKSQMENKEFSIGQNVVYIKDENIIYVEILSKSDKIILNKNLDIDYNAIEYNILYWDETFDQMGNVTVSPVILSISSDEIIDKSEWLSNNRDIKINNIINEK